MVATRIKIGIAQINLNAVVTRSSTRSGYSTESWTGYALACVPDCILEPPRTPLSARRSHIADVHGRLLDDARLERRREEIGHEASPNGAGGNTWKKASVTSITPVPRDSPSGQRKASL